MSDVEFTAGAEGGQARDETQLPTAAVGAEDFPNGHAPSDAHSVGAVGEHNPPAPAKPVSDPKDPPLGLASNSWADHNGPLLALLADALDDIESIRKATASRLRQLTRAETDKDGEERGFGLTLSVPQVAAVAAMLKAIKHDDNVLKDLGYDAKAASRPCACLECRAIRNLEKEMRKHPLGPWVKATIGVGEKQGARLIATLSDPYWNTLHDRPRTVSELWAYCGLHVVDGKAPARARGQRSNWSAAAKMRAFLVAESCIKHVRSPYRGVYDDARKQYVGAAHEQECNRCGPTGKPAPAGSPLSAGHQHARAMRRVMKELLKDLWRESKHLHGIA